MATRLPQHAVLIADPSPGVRLALRWALEEAPGIRVVAEAATGADVLRLARSLAPDLVLTEVDLPDRDGFDVAAGLRTLERPPAVLFLTLRGGPRWAKRAREVGADGLLEKGVGWEALLGAVRSALAKQTARPVRDGLPHQ